MQRVYRGGRRWDSSGPVDSPQHGSAKHLSAHLCHLLSLKFKVTETEVHGIRAATGPPGSSEADERPWWRLQSPSRVPPGSGPHRDLHPGSTLLSHPHPTAASSGPECSALTRILPTQVTQGHISAQTWFP